MPFCTTLHGMQQVPSIYLTILTTKRGRLKFGSRLVLSYCSTTNRARS